MTDAEIIKALECCIKDDYDKGCAECPVRCFKGCDFHLAKFALDYIKRQQAEIEKLKKEIIDIDRFLRNLCKERLLNGNKIATFEDLQSYINKQKSEAIREFAEKLKNLIYPQLGTTYEKGEAFHFCLDEIDNLVKEMTGGEENA